MFWKLRGAGVAGVAVLFSVLAAASNASEAVSRAELGRTILEPSMLLAGQPTTLGGDAGLACEMILCLAAIGSAPSACKSPLKKYFSLKPKRRAGFLAKCPKKSG